MPANSRWDLIRRLRVNECTKQNRSTFLLCVPLGKFPGLTICPSGKISSKIKMSTEHWWDDSARRKEVKVKFTLQQAMKAQGRAEVQFYSFFNLGARWGGWSAPRPGCFTPGGSEAVPIV